MERFKNSLDVIKFACFGIKESYFYNLYTTNKSNTTNFDKFIILQGINILTKWKPINPITVINISQKIIHSYNKYHFK